MGCGKSYWSKKWSEQFKLPLFDLDEEIEKQEKLSIAAIFVHFGETYFRKRERETLENIIKSKDTFIVSCGGGTPCFNDNIDYMNKHGTSIYLKCKEKTLFSRLISEKNKRPLLNNINNEELETFISNKLKEREIYYNKATVILNESSVESFGLKDYL